VNKSRFHPPPIASRKSRDQGEEQVDWERRLQRAQRLGVGMGEVRTKIQRSASERVQRQLEIAKKVIDPEDVFDEAIEHAGASAMAINNLIDVAKDEEMVARFSSWEEALNTYDEDVATTEDDDPVKIPQLIHFIWMGKPPSSSAVKNIFEWAARAKNTGWRIILWTDAKIMTGNWSTAISTLKKGRIEVKNLTGVLDPRIEEYYMHATRKSPKAFNMASDLARYSILKSYGGVYADVDIGPGLVDLDKVPKLSKVDPPFLAPSVRDLKALKEQLPPKVYEAFEKGELSLEEAVRTASMGAYVNNQLNNNLILTQENSAFMEELIASLPNRIEAKLEDRENWAENAALITGPQAVNKKMFNYLGMPQILYQEMDQETFENWKNLEWITQESQNQEYGSKKDEKECFLTTACVEARGLPDDCHELTALRTFRDEFVRQLDGGPELIAEYYSIAPRIVASMKLDPGFRERIGELYNQLVLGSIELIESGKSEAALELYKRHVRALSSRYL
jgi:hypothetical protein